MHRPSRVPRSICGLTLLSLVAVLALGVSHAAAQDKGTTVLVPINGSQMLEMSKKQRIKGIDNKDQNVARVEFVQGSEFRKVMILGGNQAGITDLVLTDNDGNKETFTILVELNVEFLRRVLAQAAPTANIQIMQGTGGTIILTGTVAKAEDIDIIMRTAIGAVGDPARVINGLRVGGVQTVQLDVVIARVARSEARSMGFSWLTSGTNGFLNSTTAGSGSTTSTLTNALGNVAATLSGSPNIGFGIINDNGAFLGFLNALRTENLVKVMAQPKLATLSGRPAEFISGGEQAVPTLASASGGAGGGAVAGVEFRPFGTTVRFLPLVLGGGKIYLEVEPQFTFPDPSNLFSAPIPGTNSVVFGRTTQRVQTSVVMEDGQTFAIGGMIFHQVNGTTNKIPVLGDLPFIGTAFSSVSYSDSEEELLILVTPRLVDAMDCKQLPKFLPGEETRSPDDFELFLERILEAPRGYRNVCCGNKYVPAYKNGPTAGMYPCPDCNGPRGACDFDVPAGPGCHERGCLGGGCLGGGCAGGGCAGGGCSSCGSGQGVWNSPAAGSAHPAGVQPMAPAQVLPTTPGQPMPQGPTKLPEIRSQHQLRIDAPVSPTVPVTTAPAVLLPEPPSGTPGAMLVPPTPYDPR